MFHTRVTIMGSYVADVAFRIDRLPTWGETRMGHGFQLGPGGKGSNQAVAAARAGAPGSLNVAFISKLGPDPFGEIARTLYRKEGIDTRYIFSSPNPTGAAAILGGLATALAEGMHLIEATQFACAAAGISVTRPGTAPSMPHRPEIDAIRAAIEAAEKVRLA